MKFILHMASREVRASWRRLLFFFICIAIGVGAIVSVRSVIRNLNQVLASDARAIVGSDIQIEGNRPWKTATLATINQVVPGSASRAETIEAASMLRPAEASKRGAMLVELKGIQPPYPFYGKIQLRNQAFSHHLLQRNGAIVAAPVLERLRLKVGDPVKIGEAIFHIRGVIESEPGTGGAFRFGPRVIVDLSALNKAGLTGFGSRARRRIHLKLPQDQVGSVARSLRTNLKGEFIRVRTYRQSQERVDEQFARAENFLALSGFVILVLGGIGVSSVTRVFIEQKRKNIAVLKCLGATGRKVISTYLLQILTLGCAGSIAGILLAKIALVSVGSYYASELPAGMSYGLRFGAMWQGFAFGFLITLLFSAVPLLNVRNIKPNLLLRDETGSATRKFDLLKWSTGFIVVAGLVALSSWQAGSVRVGLIFFGSLMATAAVLHMVAALLMKILRRLRPFTHFVVRYAITGLHRPGNQTHVSILAIGLGAFFIVGIHSLQSNLLREMSFERRGHLPNMYLIDIQKDQRTGVEHIIHKYTASAPELIPTVRARIAAVNGKRVNPESDEYKKDRRRLGFEYTLTFRSRLDTAEKLIAGKFWKSEPSSSPEVSIEEELKGMMGLDVGGTVTFDVLGRKIEARVTSIRRVDWNQARTGFLVVFRPGVLETAPLVYVAALNAPANEPQRSAFQRELVDQFSNVTAIDVADILRNLQGILGNVTLGVSFIAAFVFLSGVLILIGSIAMTKFQRVYETALLKTLGATRPIVAAILLIEYSLLGLVAGIIGTVAGEIFSRIVCGEVFNVPWSPTPSLYIVATASAVLLVTAVGLLSTFDVLQRKPLAVLRAQ